MSFSLLKRAFVRLFNMRTFEPYEHFLRTVSERGDAWIVPQGEYIAWWQARETARLTVTIEQGVCLAATDLERAVIECYPEQFFAATEASVACTHQTFSGTVVIALDPTLPHKALLKEVLLREGILNVVEATEGTIVLSEELVPLLDRLNEAWHELRLDDFHQTISALRQEIYERLTREGIPLFRIWYHPHFDGRIVRVVVSPRYDVDRALTNMPRIWALEHQYRAASTAYMRPFSPFYGRRLLKRIVHHPLCPEVALHGEFVGHKARFGGVVQAAVAEKVQLATLIDRDVLGVAMHGGELIENNTPEALSAAAEAGFCYDTSLPPRSYYFPYHRQREDGSFEAIYRLRFSFGDIVLANATHYTKDFLDRALRVFQLAADCHGVMVIMLHPIYFGLWRYLLHPINFGRFLMFLPVYLRRLLKSKRN